MVELPSFSKGIVTSEAPRSAVSPGQVAQPYAELANALDKTGESLEKIATPLAERAGAEAVTRDAQGNIQVDRMPIFGLAGVAYSRAMKTAALAQADGDAKRQDIALRQEFRDNPKGYATAADAYKQRAVADMRAAVGPESANSLGQAIDSTTTYTYRGLLNEKERLDLQRADNRITAGIEDAKSDLFALARAGRPQTEPAMVQSMDKVTSLLQEKLNNPRLAYTKEQYDYEVANLNGELANQRNLYHVDQVYKSQGYEAAEKAAEDIRTNPAYKLSPAQREHYYSQGMGEIRANEAIRRNDIAGLHASFNDQRETNFSGGYVSPDEISKLRAAHIAAGDTAGALRMDSFWSHADLHDAHGQLPLPQQTQDLNAVRGATAARTAYEFFRSRGYTEQQTAGIIGNLVAESSTMNPMQIHDQGIGLGIAGWNRERLDNLRSFAQQRGKPATDFQTQLEFVDYELSHGEAATGARLRLAGTPEQAANIMLGYERPKDFDIPGAHPERARYARQLFNQFAGPGADTGGGPGVQSWLIANRATELNRNVATGWKQIHEDFANGNGAIPNRKTQQEYADAAKATGNIDLQQKIAIDMSNMDLVQRHRQLPLAMQAANETQLRSQMETNSPFAGADLVAKILTERTNKIRTGLEENPIATTVTNLPGEKLQTPAPLDMSSPQSLIAGLKQRAQIAQIGAAHYQTGPLGIVDRDDMTALKAGMQSDPKLLPAIAQALKPEELQPLVRNDQFREAVTGMTRSGDSAKMNAAFSFMDTLQKQNPLQFDAQFKDGLKDLRTWQSNLSFYPPDEAAKRMMKSYDPAEQAGREAINKVVDEALKKVSPDNVVSKFSTGFIFGTTARAPVAEQAGAAAGALKFDYDENYRDGFLATGDPSAAENFAMEKLKLKYDVSPTSGNRVMAYPPERYYPQVNGSHDWMAVQLDEAVRNELKATAPAPTFAAGVEPGAFLDETSAQRQYEARRGLVSDVTTQAEIAAGKPPSYQVIIQDPNGRWGAMSGADGKPRRVRFDPTQLFAERAAGAEFVRPTMQGLQTPLAGGVTP